MHFYKLSKYAKDTSYSIFLIRIFSSNLKVSFTEKLILLDTSRIFGEIRYFVANAMLPHEFSLETIDDF